MYRVGVHAPFPQELLLGLHQARRTGNLSWVVLRFQFDSHATVFHILTVHYSSRTPSLVYITFDIVFQSLFLLITVWEEKTRKGEGGPFLSQRVGYYGLPLGSRGTYEP